MSSIQCIYVYVIFLGHSRQITRPCDMRKWEEERDGERRREQEVFVKYLWWLISLIEYAVSSTWFIQWLELVLAIYFIVSLVIWACQTIYGEFVNPVGSPKKSVNFLHFSKNNLFSLFLSFSMISVVVFPLISFHSSSLFCHFCSQTKRTKNKLSRFFGFLFRFNLEYSWSVLY